ncbi:MAG TPA: NnrU family protein [Steroidobacteraceae bacterium]|nr:NnrU family protein [Steroidobacteraceae bacterium]
MSLLIAGLVIFLGVHSVSIFAPAWRDSMSARLGEQPWKILYGVASLVGFVLIVKGYGLARQDPVFLYNPPFWMRHVSALLMLPVFPLLLATYFPGRIKAAVKHPMLTATKAWALAHLIANGTLADVLLFGGFLVWAVADRISVGKRPLRPMPGAPVSGLNDLIAVVGGLALYVVFALWLHKSWIGVAPFVRS